MRLKPRLRHTVRPDRWRAVPRLLAVCVLLRAVPTGMAAGATSPWTPSTQRVPVYTRSSPPRTPAIEELEWRDTVSQHGITWTFERPVRVGRFVNGDAYVVGPVRVTAIDPAPLYGDAIPADQLDRMDLERPAAQRVRNGFMVNPPAAMKVAYDSGIRNWFDPALIGRLPADLQPGDALVSTISMPKGLKLPAQLRNTIERGEGDSSPVRTAAILTCLGAPVPPDAFRPAYGDRGQRIHLARDLRRELLPRVPATLDAPDPGLYARFTQRPWLAAGFFGFDAPVENMPQYGLEFGRVSGLTALRLCTDLAEADREPLLVNFVQVGLDLGGLVRAGHPGWTGWGGHGSGRKLPIVFAGLLLGDEELANIGRSFPKASFGEDEQTAYGPAWTGARVVFAGHSGIDRVTGEGRSRGNGWGPYEHLPPEQWGGGQKTSESYRRCCTSVGWVAQALALRLLQAEAAWSHDAFFDYVDRWMSEDDSVFVKRIRDATGQDHDKEWARQGQAWDRFVNDMWARHRPGLPAPTNGWTLPHDESAYRKAAGLGTDDPAGAAPGLRTAPLWSDSSRLGRPFAKDPSVVRFGDRYLLYFSLPPFTPELAPTNAPRGWSIGVAESINLRTWRKVGELWPEQECERNGLCAPGARVIDGRVHLFYQTYGNGPRDAICHAVSDDGLRFVRDASNPVFRPSGDWNSGRAIDAEVFEDGDRFLLYFATRDPAGKIQMLGVAEARRGAGFGRDAWRQLGDGPVLKPELPWEKQCIEAPSVLRRGELLYLFYAGGYNNDPQQVGVATSRDGIRWTRLVTQPLLANGQPGDWNASESGHPGVFVDADDRTWLFFQGNPDRGRTWHLSRVGIAWRGQRPRVLDAPRE